MNNIVDLWEWKRARLAGENRYLSPRPPSRRRECGNSGLVGMGEVSLELLRRLTFE